MTYIQLFKHDYYFRALVIHGLFDMFCYGLVDEDQTLRNGCVSLLASFTDLDVNTVRSHLTGYQDDKDLLHVIVSQFTTDADYDFKVQYAEILRLLLDPNGNVPTTAGPSLTVDVSCLLFFSWQYIINYFG